MRLAIYAERRISRRKRPRLAKHAPGGRILWLTQRIYSKRTFEEVFLPSVSDLRREHCESLRCNGRWHNRWVLIRGYWSIGATVVSYQIWNTVKLVVTVWKAVR